MDIAVMFLDCPEYMDTQLTVRCGLPAEVLCRYEVASTDGPLESAKIRCPRGHWFNGPIEFLSWDKRPEAVCVVGEEWAARSDDLRELLGRNGIPFGFYAADGRKDSTYSSGRGAAADGGAVRWTGPGGPVHDASSD
jgi:hypothetical protein